MLLGQVMFQVTCGSLSLSLQTGDRSVLRTLREQEQPGKEGGHELFTLLGGKVEGSHRNWQISSSLFPVLLQPGTFWGFTSPGNFPDCCTHLLGL